MNTLKTNEAYERQLQGEHEQLDEKFDRIVAQARACDWNDFDQGWQDFAAQLEHHMHVEEKQLFPKFAATGATGQRQVKRLKAQHEEIRRCLHELALDLELHCLRLVKVQAFISRLRQHAKSENAIFYPWLKTSLAARWQPVAQ